MMALKRRSLIHLSYNSFRSRCSPYTGPRTTSFFMVKQTDFLLTEMGSISISLPLPSPDHRWQQLDAML